MLEVLVASCTNDQLSRPEDSDPLLEAEVLHAPESVIEAGGGLHALSSESLGWPHAVATRLESMGDTLLEIYARAEAEGVGTNAAAEDLARSRTSGESSSA